MIEIIQKQRKQQYGEYYINIQNTNVCRESLEIVAMNNNHKSVGDSFYLDITKTLMCLKLSRLETCKDYKVNKDSIIDFYNYFYLLTKNILVDNILGKIEIVRLSLIKPIKLHNELIHKIVSIIVDNNYNRENYNEIKKQAEIALNYLERV